MSHDRRKIHRDQTQIRRITTYDVYEYEYEYEYVYVRIGVRNFRMSDGMRLIKSWDLSSHETYQVMIFIIGHDELGH